MVRKITFGRARARMHFALAMVLCSGLVTPAWAEASKILTLQAAIGRALDNSPALASAVAGVDAAKGSELQSSLLPNPTASLEIENIAGTGEYRAFRGSETTLSASQLIELGGKRIARQDAATAGRKVAEFDQGAARLDLIRDVTLAYIEAEKSMEALKLALEMEQSAKRVLADVSKRVDAARDPLYQRNRAEVSYTTANIARQRTEQESNASRAKLARFWGEQDVGEQLEPAALFEVSAPEKLSTFESRLNLSPDIIKLDRVKEARAAELRLAEAGAVPDLTVSAGVKRLEANRDTAFVAGVSLPIPIFNQNQGEIARASAEVVRATKERQQAERQRATELIESWSSWNKAWIEVDNLKNLSLPQAEKAYERVLAGYRAGAFQFLDVLDTQRTLFETRTAYLDGLARLQSAHAQTERLTAAATSLSEFEHASSH